MEKISQSIIVVGATGGIGGAISRKLLDTRHAVIGISSRASHTDPAISKHKKYTHSQIDLAVPGTRVEKLKSLRQSLDAANKSVSAVFMIAGIPAFGRIENIAPDQVMKAIEINLSSVVDIAKIFKPALLEHVGRFNQPASLIVFGSEADSLPGTDGPVYCATKFGVRGLIESLQPSWSRDNIRISLISPGAVRTPFYENTYFRPGESPDNALTVEQCTEAALFCMNFPAPGGIDHIRLSPKTRVFTKKQVSKR